MTPAPTSEQQALTFSASEYLDKIKSVFDYRIIGIAVMVVLIVFWTVIEILA